MNGIVELLIEYTEENCTQTYRQSGKENKIMKEKLNKDQIKLEKMIEEKEITENTTIV